MAKKKPGETKMPTTADVEMRHARIELPDSDYRRLKKAAERYRLSVSAYVRMAVLKQVEVDYGREEVK